MEPEERARQYHSSVRRAAWIAIPSALLAAIPAIVGMYVLTDKTPIGWRALLVIFSGVAIVSMIFTFAFLRRCPECGCRSPLVKGSRRSCRKCRSILMRSAAKRSHETIT